MTHAENDTLHHRRHRSCRAVCIGGIGGPVAYGQKAAVGLWFGYRQSGRNPLRDRAVTTSK
jgi:hypothetical protein